MLKLIICLSLLLLLPSLSHAAFDNEYEKGANITKPQIDIMQNFLDAPLTDIYWCGEKRNTIFILTEKATVYRSVDNGFTGHRLTEHLEKIGKQEMARYAQTVGTVFKVIQSPVDKNMMIFLGSEGINWITDDCGVNFRAMDQGRRIDDFQFHPTEKNWILASAWTKCEDFGSEPCKKYKELFFSSDLGNKWELIAEYVFDFSWGLLDATFISTPKERIVVTIEPKAKGNQKLVGWSHTLSVVYSDDFFKTTTTLLKGGNKFLLTRFYIFAVQVSANEEQGVTLYVGDSKLNRYKLRPIELPMKKLTEHSYTILDTSEHSVFLHINHDGDQSKYGSIFVSDSTGVRYSMALPGSVRNLDGQCDFERVQGLEGIYLANTYEKSILKKFKTMNPGDSFPHQHPGSKKVTGTNSLSPLGRGDKAMDTALYSADATKRSLNDFKKTMISFDKGGIWQTLNAPYLDYKGDKISCAFDQEKCSLHLHSVSNTNFGPFYTTSSSMGLIIGTGNVGGYLSNRADEINTYFSRDAGLTWFEISNGSHIYEIGDHGSIIVIAPDQYATTEIKYSWDEGLTWETLKISDVPIEIQNIITEPTNTAEKFIIYGRLADKSGKGVITAIDFTPLHKRWCVGHDKPDTPESDYETWSPNGKITENCLLGRKMTFIRRKRDSACFNSEENESWSYNSPCECTEEDWECDYGYAREGSGPCVPTSQRFVNDSMTPPEQCDAYYFVTQGYRKVAGDSCVGGVVHNPIRLPCPGVSVLNSKNFNILVVLVTIVLAMIWLSKKGNTERIKDFWSSFSRKWFSKLPKSLGKGPVGFRRIDEIPDTLRDDEEDDFGKIVFEETEEKAEPIEDTSLLDVAKGKRMTEKRGVEAANKQVPVLSKPGERRDKKDY